MHHHQHYDTDTTPLHERSKERKLAVLLGLITALEIAGIFVYDTIQLFGTPSLGVLAFVLIMPFTLIITLNVGSPTSLMMLAIAACGAGAADYVFKQYEINHQFIFVIWIALIVMYAFANSILLVLGPNYFPANFLVLPDVSIPFL